MKNSDLYRRLSPSTFLKRFFIDFYVERPVCVHVFQEVGGINLERLLLMLEGFMF